MYIVHNYEMKYLRVITTQSVFYNCNVSICLQYLISFFIHWNEKLHHYNVFNLT